MSREPKDTEQQPKSSADAENSSETNPSNRPESAREMFTRLTSGNPRFIQAKPSGQAFVIVGARPSSGKPAAFETLLTTLRHDEPALGTLSPADQNWLAAALAYLIQIDESRWAENAHGSSYCIFDAGRVYFQCLAPSFSTYLRCESVSEKYIPEMGAILTPEKRDRLVREFGFVAPGYSKNFSQKIEINRKDDLAYVARMAFRVLRDVYDVKDLGATKFKVSIPTPAVPLNSDPHAGGNGPADS